MNLLRFGFHRVCELVWQNKQAFLGTFFGVFLLSYIFLVAVDFVPEPVEAGDKEELLVPKNEETTIEHTALENPLPVGSIDEPVLPTSIYIKKLDRTIPVLNPESRAITDLDTALLSGAVRHPDSAKLAQNGNVFILGHSSYLPSVVNKNFQAFNGIQNLAWGDIIEVSSGSEIHVYEVERVFKATASDLTVPIASEEKKLTLATCNSFGSTNDRFIVEAKQVSVRPL
jgi:LPXTG-site transpeptidase (sortase) family protein